MHELDLIRLLTNRGVDAITVRQPCQHCEAGDGRNWTSWGGCSDRETTLFSGGNQSGGSGGGTSGGTQSGGSGGGMAPPTPTILQDGQAGGDSPNGARAVTWGTGTTAGSCLVYFLITNCPGGSHPSVATPAGMTLVDSVTQQRVSPGDWVTLYVFVYPNAPSVTTQTFTDASGSGVFQILAFEVANADPVSPIDQFAGEVGTGSPSDTGTTPMTTRVNELAIAFIAGQQAVTSVSSGFSLIVALSTSWFGSAYEANVGLQTVDCQGTFGASEQWWSAIVVVK